jgi:hypothetical protein
MSRNDGGNAFPVADYDHETLSPTTVDECKRQLLGMSLRDYFAAKAMQAIVTGNNADECSLGLGAAKDAYAVADAMLVARSK